MNQNTDTLLYYYIVFLVSCEIRSLRWRESFLILLSSCMDCPLLQLLCTMVRLSQHSRTSLALSPSPYSPPSSTGRHWRTDLWTGEGLLFSTCTALYQPMFSLTKCPYCRDTAAIKQFQSKIPFVNNKCCCGPLSPPTPSPFSTGLHVQ